MRSNPPNTSITFNSTKSLKEDYSSLYKLILAFGQSPQTITLPATYKPEPLSQHFPTQNRINPPNLSKSQYPLVLQNALTRPSTRHQIKSRPPNPTEYKRKIRNFLSDSLLSLRCDSPEETPSSPIKKPLSLSSAHSHQKQPPHPSQLSTMKQQPTDVPPHHTLSQLPTIKQQPTDVPSHFTLHLGDPKQIMAITMLKTSIPLDHPTIFKSSTNLTKPTTPAKISEASEELSNKFGVNLKTELSRKQKKRKV